VKSFDRRGGALSRLSEIAEAAGRLVEQLEHVVGHGGEAGAAPGRAARRDGAIKSLLKDDSPPQRVGDADTGRAGNWGGSPPRFSAADEWQVLAHPGRIGFCVAGPLALVGVDLPRVPLRSRCERGAREAQFPWMAPSS
jgi:hypothetical protein